MSKNIVFLKIKISLEINIYERDVLQLHLLFECLIRFENLIFFKLLIITPLRKYNQEVFGASGFHF